MCEESYSFPESVDRTPLPSVAAPRLPARVGDVKLALVSRGAQNAAPVIIFVDAQRAFRPDPDFREAEMTAPAPKQTQCVEELQPPSPEQLQIVVSARNPYCGRQDYALLERVL